MSTLAGPPGSGPPGAGVLGNGVVAVGPRSGPYLDRTAHVVHLDQAMLDDLPSLHDVLAEQVSLQGPIVAVLPRRLAAHGERAIATVRAAMGGAPVRCHVTDLPPLAADVLVTLAGAVHQHLGNTAAVAATLPALEQQILCLTWLPTVKGVTTPAPTLAQHAGSAVPGRSWLVRSWPRPEILRYDLERLPALPVPGQQVGVAVADAGGDVAWVPRVVGALPGAVGVQVDPPPDTTEHWGSRGSTQVAVYPRDVPRLASALAERLLHLTCRWCRREMACDVTTPACPWCRLPLDHAPGAGPGTDPGDDPTTEAA